MDDVLNRPAEKPVKIVVASGKGGTGKTSVAVNMAVSCGVPVVLADCDAEAPNAHLFFRRGRIDIENSCHDEFFDSVEEFSVSVPEFNNALCNGCGFCKTVCKFNAITMILGKPLFFAELCHSCEACFRVCSMGAITAADKMAGKIRRKKINGEIALVDGILNVSEAKSPPLIKKVIKKYSGPAVTIIDAPPGTSCPMVAASYSADYVILVTEPTPFGLSDLKLAVNAMRELKVSFGVVINKYDGDFGEVKTWCEREKIDIIGIIPFDLKIAQVYSGGGIIADELPHTRGLFSKLFERAVSEALK